jgi:hypothetical protein
MTIIWQRLEGVLTMLSALAVFYSFNESLPWWPAIIIFFAPDISFLAYLMGPRIGAFFYNLVHVYALGAIIAASGIVFDSIELSLIGLLLIAHCGFDRARGYGLKHRSGFEQTHLGLIGKSKKPNQAA